MKLKKILSLTLTVIMLAASITGCGNAEKKEETQGAASTEKTHVKISAINVVNWAPVYLAKAEGFFDKQGLDVEFTTPGGPKGFQALHAGDCQFSMLSQEPLLIAQEQGMESKVIATMLKSRNYGLISKKDITDISQLKGKLIYGSESGSAPYTFTCNVLRINGLDPLNDVTFVQAADQVAGIQALLNGEVEAAFVNISNLPVIKDFEYNILANTTNSEDSIKYLGSDEFPAEMLCTTTAYTKEHPEICQKVVNALVEAQKWIAEHSDEEVAKALKSSFGNFDEALIAEEIKLLREKYAVDCMVTEKGQKAVVDMCVEAGLIKNTIPYEDVVDMSFAKKAN